MLKISLILFVFSNLLFSASFNCTKASSDVERIICADAELSQLDTKMGFLYKKVYEQIDDKKDLLNKQRSWIKEREQCITQDCAFMFLSNRINELENFLETNNIHKKVVSSNENIPEKTRIQRKPSFFSQDEIPFEIDFDYTFNSPYIVITSLKDNLQIDNIKLNKGKCELLPYTKYPIILNEYDSFRAYFSNECNLIRLDVVTKDEEWILQNNQNFIYFKLR